MTLPAAIILAGGKATRLYPLTKEIAKAMIDINGEPFIYHQLKMLKEKGVSKVVICAGYLGESIKNLVRNGESYNVDVKYSFDGDKLLGTGGAVKKAVALAGDEFFVMYGDSYFDLDLHGIYSDFKKSGKDALMVIIKNENRWDKSNVVFENGDLIEYSKTKHSKKMKYIDYGLAVLKSSVLDDLPEGEAFDLADIYSKLVKEKRMIGYEASERFYEIGSPDGLEETKKFIAGGSK